MGGSDNTGDGLASQPRCYRVPGQPLLNRHQVGGCLPQPRWAVCARGSPPGRSAVRAKGMTRKPPTTPHTNNNSPPRGAQVPPTPPSVPPTLPSVPLHCHCTQQDVPTSLRLIDPAGGSPKPRGSEAPEAFCRSVSARRGLGTQRATTGAPEASCGTASARRGSGTHRATPGAPAARCCSLPVPRGSSTQWATTGAPEAHCGKERWSRKEKEPPTKPGWAEPRTTARPQCSVNRLGHHAGAHTTGVNNNGVHATREAHATHDHQGTRHAHARPTEWWSTWGGLPVQAWRSGALGPHTHGNAATQVVDDRRAEVHGQQKPSNDPHNNQLNLGAPTTELRHKRHQHSPSTPTIGLHERGNDTSRSTSCSGRQNAATQCNMRREEQVTVQGPVKK